MKVQFDDNDQGGFTVTEGELKEVPYGWEEVSPGRFEPKWPSCRYRRTSHQSVRGRVNVIPYCLLIKKPVLFDTCATCERAKPPYEYLEMTPEILAAIKAGNPDMLPHAMRAEPDPIFLPETVDRPLWLACKYRYQRKPNEEDCCAKNHCGNAQCPRYEQRLRKRDCKDCELRDEDQVGSSPPPSSPPSSPPSPSPSS